MESLKWGVCKNRWYYEAISQLEHIAKGACKVRYKIQRSRPNSSRNLAYFSLAPTKALRFRLLDTMVPSNLTDRYLKDVEG